MSASLEDDYKLFVYNRCKKVINSCTRREQLEQALAYCRLFRNTCYNFDRIWPLVCSVYMRKIRKLINEL